MFCQLELLRHSFPPSVRRILDELPESLDETYERILREIKRPNQRHAHRLLQCLVAAVRPLQVKELGEVLAVDFTAEGFPKLNPVWRWEDQEEAVLSAIFAFFRQGILDGGAACGTRPRCLVLSHSTRSRAYGSCTSMPWRPPSIGRQY